MKKILKNQPKPGECYIVKDLYFYKSLDLSTGHLSGLEVIKRNFFYVICLDVIKINSIKILVLFCEEGIRYSHFRIFSVSVVLDSPAEHS